jgi:alkaline phosphatase D
MRGFAAAALLAASVGAFAQPRLASTPMIAWVEMTEAAIWTQATEDTEIRLTFSKAGEESYSAQMVMPANQANDHIALFKLTGLEFGQEYKYTVWAGDRATAFEGRFKTQPHWRWRIEPPTIKFAFGSCNYDNDPPFDRPGNPYGGDHQIFDHIAAAKPDFMLWLGDNIYYREPDWMSEAAMRYRWRHNRSRPYLQQMWPNMAHYATWDDHDYGPNDSDRSYRLKETALEVFNDYFPSPVRGTEEAKGAFFKFEWGDAEFFMLDDRYHRTPNRHPNRAEAVQFGREQLNWLKDSLASSLAPFKFICSGGQMINPMVFFEAFGQAPTEQKELFDFLVEAKIEGVVFLSGDRHAGELLKVQYPGAAYPWFEFTSSPLSAGAGRYEPEAENPARVPGTWITRTRNFGLAEITGPRTDRALKFTATDAAGKVLWTHDIRANDLRWPRAN